MLKISIIKNKMVTLKYVESAKTCQKNKKG